MQRGFEAERLAVYFEEMSAYEYKQMNQKPNNSPGSGGEEITEFELGDQEALIWEPDEEEE